MRTSMILEGLIINTEQIRNVLDTPVSPDDLTGVQDKLIRLIEVAGLASFTEAKAKALYEQELGVAYTNALGENMNTGHSGVQIVAKGRVGHILQVVSYAERLGRNISHSMDALRTIISLQKEELSQSKYGDQT